MEMMHLLNKNVTVTFILSLYYINYCGQKQTSTFWSRETGRCK